MMSENLEPYFLNSTHWIDVRAPIEFAEGSVPGAVNLPLLTDTEREQVGITYKMHGQQAAIDLGNKLVSGEIKKSRINAWLNEIERFPNSVIYCFRGGLRSQTVQAWLKEQGVSKPIIPGGYKSARRLLLEIIDSRSASLDFEVVCGPTGSGKTKFLHESKRPFIDLEALARHRGSAFGALEVAQPSQADFENALAVKLLEVSDLHGPVLIEDESKLIGRSVVPAKLILKMKNSPRLYLQPSLEDRIENIFCDYILNSKLGLSGDLSRFDEFRKAVSAISSKLGGARAKEILLDLDHSQAEFASGCGLESNRIWIQKLLQWYYDMRYGTI